MKPYIVRNYAKSGCPNLFLQEWELCGPALQRKRKTKTNDKRPETSSTDKINKFYKVKALGADLILRNLLHEKYRTYLLFKCLKEKNCEFCEFLPRYSVSIGTQPLALSKVTLYILKKEKKKESSRFSKSAKNVSCI